MVDYTTNPNPIVRTPRQATTIFGLDGNQAPRKKSQFYVRFRRSGAAGDASPEWERNMGFMVKSVDRPSVTPRMGKKYGVHGKVGRPTFRDPQNGKEIWGSW